MQAWANATCATVRSANNLVTLHPESKETPVTIDDKGQWVNVAPQQPCSCDPVTGRVAGEAPSRAEMVKEFQKETAAFVGKDNLQWHYLLRALRTGFPHLT